MNQIEFNAKYGTEEQCRQHLFSVRWGKGFECPKCGGRENFDIKSRNLYQCKKCNHQTSVTAGTIMDKTRTPLVKWYMAMYYMSEDKRGISELSLMSKIGVAYQTAWSMCHKIRQAMSTRDEKYSPDGKVELDELFSARPRKAVNVSVVQRKPLYSRLFRLQTTANLNL